MKLLNKDTASYSNDRLEPLFVGWFEQDDEDKKAELLQMVEVEVLVEIEEQMPFIRRVCRDYPTVDPQDFRIDVERHAIHLAFQRPHHDPNEPRGDIDKRLRAYWNDKEKRKLYPCLYAQIQHVVRSIVCEAITRNPRWKYIRDPSWLASIYQTFARQSRTPIPLDYLLLEALFTLYDAGGFSEDERQYILFIRQWEGDSPPTGREIENAMGWGQSKAHRVKKSIETKVKRYLDNI